MFQIEKGFKVKSKHKSGNQWKELFKQMVHEDSFLCSLIESHNFRAYVHKYHGEKFGVVTRKDTASDKMRVWLLDHEKDSNLPVNNEVQLSQKTQISSKPAYEETEEEVY